MLPGDLSFSRLVMMVVLLYYVVIKGSEECRKIKKNEFRIEPGGPHAEVIGKHVSLCTSLKGHWWRDVIPGQGHAVGTSLAKWTPPF